MNPEAAVMDAAAMIAMAKPYYSRAWMPEEIAGVRRVSLPGGWVSKGVDRTTPLEKPVH